MIKYAARSHVGRVRGHNEDNLYVDGVSLTPGNRERPFAIDGCADGTVIFAVCDGMGGEANGEAASLTAVQRLLAADEAIKAAPAKALGETVQQKVNDMNQAIRSGASITGRRAGTTIALAVVNEAGIHCFNMGDSRIYALYQDIFRQITTDHKQGGNAGHKLTRCIGIGDVYAVEKYPPVPRGSHILICSDGLTDMVRAAEIEKILRTSETTANAADQLLDAALGNGGNDNITVIVADISHTKMSYWREWVNDIWVNNRWVNKPKG